MNNEIKTKSGWVGGLVVVSLVLGATGVLAAPVESQATDSLQARIDELDQKIRVIERLNEIAVEEAKAAAAKAAKATAGDGGFGTASGDNAYSLRLRGFIQAQSLSYLSKVGATPVEPVEAWTIRRLHTDIVGNVGKQLEIRSHINVASGTVDVQDVYLDWKIRPEFALRLGKFKSPTGLERLFSYARAPFVEGSFVTLLQPNRDIGLQAFGSVFDGRLEYQAAVLNGARDNQNNTGDNNNDKDFYGRLFATPFAKFDGPIKGIGFGVSGSVGEHKQYNNVATTARVVTSDANNGGSGTTPTTITTNAAVTNGIASYTTGRQAFFSYAANDTSEGTVSRISPQAWYYYGPLGVIAEYTTTTQSIRRATFEKDLTNAAWAVTASWLLTGEENNYRRIRVKKANTLPTFDGIGGIEILGRVHAIKIDDKAFEALNPADLRVTYANAATQASEALGYGLAAKWYLNNSVNLFAGYELTTFTGGAGTAATATVAPVVLDRQAEKVITASLNVAF